MSIVSMKELLESGVHFGHQTRRWNPKMDRYIFTDRGGIHIVDLQQTVKMLDDAYKQLLEIASNGGRVLFVGTKKQARKVIQREAERAGQFYVSERWLGGTLTNFKTIRKSIRKLHNLYRKEKDGTFDLLTKKEAIIERKEIARLERNLGGIKSMKTTPEAVFVVDPMQDINAVKEANILDIPVFGIVDTNCDPDLVDIIIPGNDDAIRSIQLITSKMADACIAAQNGQGADKQDKKQENKQDDKKPAKTATKKPVKKTTKKSTTKAKKEAKPVEKETPKKETKPVKKEEVKTPAKPKKAKTPAKSKKTKTPAKPVKKEEVKTPAKPKKTETPKAKKAEPKKVEKKAEPKTKSVNEKRESLAEHTVKELKEMCKERGISGYSRLRKAELIETLSNDTK